MIDIITISSKGQVVIPKSLREEAGLNKQDKLLVLSDNGKIILEKISKKEVKEKMSDLLDFFSKQFKEKGITRTDVEKEIEAVRKQNA
ncbi:MAG: AbrB/MazE/SpoVT family DNA-binding domain-containing protein [Nanoarchaeota archaeon]